MRGELWQECRRSGCDTEPVCACCEYCRSHCVCRRDPTPQERAAQQEAQAKKQVDLAAARSALVERLSSDDADPLDAPLEYRRSTGEWRPLKPEARGRFLDMVLAREEWYAPRMKRDPMTTRLEVVRFLAPGATIHYDSDWYAELRIHPEETQ